MIQHRIDFFFQVWATENVSGKGSGIGMGNREAVLDRRTIFPVFK